MITAMRASWLAAALCFAAAWPAYADINDPASDAEVVGEQVQRDLQPPPGPLPEEPVIEQPPAHAPPSEAPAATFRLTEVSLEGSTVLPRSHFDPIIQPYLNREVSPRELETLAQAIQQAYRAKGYITTVVYVPPQKILGGRVTLQVLEGRMGKLAVEGNRHFSAGLFDWYWPLDAGAPLQYGAMRQALIRMNAHPDRKVQALLRAGTAPGETDVTLKVQDRPPLHLTSFLDRGGTPSIGQYRFGLAGAHYNLLGRDDRLTVGMVFGDNFGVPYVLYQIPVTPRGTVAGFRYSHSQVSPHRQFNQFGILGRSDTYGLSLTQPFIEQGRMMWDGRLGFDIKENQTKISSGGSGRRDRLRVLRMGSAWQRQDPWGRWLADVEGSWGVNGLGASSVNNPTASRSGTRPDFAKVEWKLTRAQQMPWRTRLVASADSQLASSKLSPSEQLYLGGQDSVRGYPEGDYLADSGLILRGEYLVPVRIMPEAWRIPGLQGPLHEHLDVLAFADRGYGRLRAITGEERADRNLAGVGMGLQFRMPQATARIELGFAVGDKALTDDSSRMVHLSLHSSF